MLIAYLMTLIPAATGATLWITNRKVVWWEWLLGMIVALTTVGIFHLIMLNSMTSDTETWSGRVTKSTHYPYWHASWWETETYTETIGTKTVGFGKNKRTIPKTVTKTRRVRKTASYPEHWETTVNYGKNKATYSITKTQFQQHLQTFGLTKPKAIKGSRTNMDSGDPNDYIAENSNNATIPAHKQVSFENRVKACPSTFSYAKVPDNTPVHDYPKSKNWHQSNRLLGTATGHFTIHAWDCLNAQLGPKKKVNLIAIGFQGDSTLGHYQEAKWYGGKKNDLVICYGPLQNNKPTWAYCFGWTEKQIVKRNLETLLLDNTPNDQLIPKIKQQVTDNYQLKDWDKFNYLSIEPPLWSYITLLLTITITQTGFWFWAHHNQINEKTT